MMSQTSTITLSALALSLTFGAIQFASGSDLGQVGDDVDQQAQRHDVNRAAKSDRAPLANDDGGPAQTMSFRLHDMSETSVLVRIPAARLRVDAVNGRPVAPVVKPSTSERSERKVNVACEPVVSVLTEVAKRLQPGRCVT